MESTSNPDLLNINYNDWNRILAHYFLSTATPGHEFYLAVSPSLLAATYMQSYGVQIPLDVASLAFANSVTSTYLEQMIIPGSRRSIIRTKDSSEVPCSLAFLVFSVLAAYTMHKDEDNAANAYYPRLARLLSCQSLPNGIQGLTSTEFRRAWFSLKEWFSKWHHLNLAMPERAYTTDPYSVTTIPCRHALLRRIDLAKLPIAFWQAGYNPGDCLSEQQFDRLMKGLSLTHDGHRMLVELPQAVLAQVNQELLLWDGSFGDEEKMQSSTGSNADDAGSLTERKRNNAIISLHLEFDRKQQPELYYAPQRLAHFPTTFDTGRLELEASGDSEYDFVPVRPEDGDQLQKGFVWHDCHHKPLTLHWHGASIIVFTKDTLDNFGTRLGLPLNSPEPCYVFCHNTAKKEVDHYLRLVTDGSYDLCTDHLPNGWIMFGNVVANKVVPGLDALEGLEIIDKASIRLAGGLRLGRRNAWIKGAPPQVSVYGSDSPVRSISITGHNIAGHVIALNENGEFNTDETLTSPGSYVVTAGDTSERIEIIEPGLESIAKDGKDTWELPATADYDLLALPTGNWWLLGSQPDQVISWQQDGGSRLMRSPFKVVWAIKLHHNTETAQVVCLMEDASAPTWVPDRSVPPDLRVLLTQWSHAIVSSTTHRPKRLSLGSCWDRRYIRITWVEYLRTAKKIRKMLKER